MTWVAAAGASAALTSKVFSAIKASRENKKNDRLVESQMNELNSDYNNTANKSFLDTNAAKDQVKVINDQAEKARKDEAGRAVITGGSDEAVVAANSNIQKNVNNATSNLAGQATAYQHAQKQMYYNRKDRLNAIKMGRTDARADNATALGANASDMFSTIAYNAGMNKKE